MRAPLFACALGVALLAGSMTACKTSREVGRTSPTRSANLPPDDSDEVVFRKVRTERIKVSDENDQDGSVEAVTHSNGRPGGAVILTRKQPRGHVELTTGIYGPGLYVRSPGSMKHGLWAYVQDNGFPASNLLLFFEGSRRAKIMGYNDGGRIELLDANEKVRMRFKVSHNGGVIEFIDAKGKVVKTISETSS